MDWEVTVRDRLYKRAVITQNDDDWVAYKQQRNRVVALIRRQKEIFYQEKVDEVKDDAKEMWKTLKKLMGASTRQHKDSITFDNRAESDPSVIAERFNNYFIESIEQISTRLSVNQIEYSLQGLSQYQCKFESFHVLEFGELKKMVRSIKNKNSSLDGITAEIFKLAFEVMGNRFLDVINASLQKGSFPRTWKTSTVIPIEKKTGTVKCEEYRPINMLPLYEKVLELAANKQIRDYVEDNRLLTPH